MGVGIDQDLAGQGEPVLGHEHVGDAVLPHGEVVLDAEAVDELAQALGVVCSLDGRRRHHVVVHHRRASRGWRS